MKFPKSTALTTVGATVMIALTVSPLQAHTPTRDQQAVHSKAHALLKLTAQIARTNRVAKLPRRSARGPFQSMSPQMAHEERALSPLLEADCYREWPN